VTQNNTLEVTTRAAINETRSEDSPSSGRSETAPHLEDTNRIEPSVQLKRLLYLYRGLQPPGPDERLDRFTYKSKIAEGDVLLPVWWSSPKDVAPHLKDSFPKYRVGNFVYYMFLEYRYPGPLRPLARLLFFLRRGVQLNRQNKFDAIVVYGTNVTGVAGVLLKWLTGAKLIAQLPNVPENSYRYDKLNPGLWESLKRGVADVLLNLAGSRADCLRLFYPWQLRCFPRLQGKPAGVFNSFVPVRTIAGQVEKVYGEEKYVLSVGYPWHTKGMDILIRAFRKIAGEFPDYKLILLGHYPDRQYLDELAQGCPQIELLRARPNEETRRIFGRCAVYVLASRTDACPRVLFEAMAGRKAIIASDVGGVRHYIRDNDNGLLFQSGNVDELAAKLASLLGNPELRARLANRGYERVMAEFNEDAYVESYRQMLEL
jgi:glycosyltransferase involved in cell wall biosynthesis